MYAHFEVNATDLNSKGNDSLIKIDSSIQSLSWMSKYSIHANVGDKVFNKSLYYEDGWLASGNSNLMVGCSFTSCISPEKDPTIEWNKSNGETTRVINNCMSNQANHLSLNRSNFNLRGHKSEVRIVKWNEPFQKLASCDSKGTNFIWAKYEGRWSIELINDRGCALNDFAWSHDGRMALLCYQDGCVLAITVNGQRIWSQPYELANCFIKSATWSPNDEFIVFGLSNGNLMIVDEDGFVQTHVNVKHDEISQIAYNSPKFYTELIRSFYQPNPAPSNNNSANSPNDRGDNSNQISGSSNAASSISLYGNKTAFFLMNICNFNGTGLNRNDLKLKNKINNDNYMLACSFSSSSLIYLLKNYKDLNPIIIDTKLKGVKFEWSNSGQILAVGGYEEVTQKNVRAAENGTDSAVIKKINYIHFYNTNGDLIYKLKIPSIQSEKNIFKYSIIDRLENGQKRQSSSARTTAATPAPTTTTTTTSSGGKDGQLDELPDDGLFTALTWGHNDQRLFVACSNILHVVRVHKQIPSLTYLCEQAIKSFIPSQECVKDFLLPDRLKQEMRYCFASTLKTNYPKLRHLREFVCTCETKKERLYCTIKKMNIKNNNEYFILYQEFLGGLVPLLSARKSSKLKPNFVIFNPFVNYKPPPSTVPNVLCNNPTRNNNNNLKNTSNEVDCNVSKSSGFYSAITSSSTSTPPPAPQPVQPILSQNLNPIDEIKTVSTRSRHTTRGKKANSLDSGSLASYEDSTANSSISNLCKISLSSLSESSRSRSRSRRSSESSSLLFVRRHESHLNTSNKLRKVFARTNHNKNKHNVYSKKNKRRSATSHKQQQQQLTKSGTRPATGVPRSERTSKHLKTKKNNILVDVKSNIWGTRFKFHGHKYLPNFIGQIVYKTSLFHLQPRQMKITLEDLSDYHYGRRKCERKIKKTAAEELKLNSSPATKTATQQRNNKTKSILSGENFSSSILGVIPGETADVTNETADPTMKRIRRSSLSCSSLVDLSDFNPDGGGNLAQTMSTAQDLFQTKLLRQAESIREEETQLPKLNLLRVDDLAEICEDASTDQDYMFGSDTPTVEQPKPADSMDTKLETQLLINRRLKLLNRLSPNFILNYLKFRKNSSPQSADYCKSAKIKPHQEPAPKQRNQFILHNKPPIWNETSQVYQLDFGGRVTQESAKNFQVEHNGKQVLQFGRIDTNAYTLDFEWPFTTVQAFSIALANITQRLK